ncbi:hypothetical protein ACFPRL_10120 [Pseudoclavibacter helvolus]
MRRSGAPKSARFCSRSGGAMEATTIRPRRPRVRRWACWSSSPARPARVGGCAVLTPTSPRSRGAPPDGSKPGPPAHPLPHPAARRRPPSHAAGWG